MFKHPNLATAPSRTAVSLLTAIKGDDKLQRTCWAPHLKAAGIPYRDDVGRVADFYALRVTFATMLLRSGVDVRHATINMTADVYACALCGSLNEAVKRLPDLSTPQTEQLRATGSENADLQPMKKTGTYDAPLRTSAHENAGCFQPAKLPPRGFEPLSPA